MAEKQQHEFVKYILEDVLGGIENITSRAMFGGYGIYRDGIIFAIIAFNELYFKVGDTNIRDYKDTESHPFVYDRGRHMSTTMSYWLVPDEIINDKNKIVEWVDKAVAVSKQRKTTKNQ